MDQLKGHIQLSLSFVRFLLDFKMLFICCRFLFGTATFPPLVQFLKFLKFTLHTMSKYVFVLEVLSDLRSLLVQKYYFVSLRLC